MKITKSKLKHIVKESIEDEYKQKIKQLMYSGDEGHIEQAAALLDALMPENTTSVVVYLVYSKIGEYEDKAQIYGAYSSLQKAKMAISGITPYQKSRLKGDKFIGVLPIMIDDPLKSRNPGGDDYDYLIGHGEDWDPIE